MTQLVTGVIFPFCGLYPSFGGIDSKKGDYIPNLANWNPFAPQPIQPHASFFDIHIVVHRCVCMPKSRVRLNGFVGIPHTFDVYGNAFEFGLHLRG